MSNALVPVATRDLMPTVAERGPDCDHVPETWGLYPGVLPREKLHREPPTRDVLAAMQDELASGLVPLSVHARGKETAAKAALVLVESYPMRDQTGSLYADRLVQMLLQLPHDLVNRVVDHLVRHHIHRPAPAEVDAVVQRHLARRRLLLLRVQAGIRYWDWLAEERAAQAEREARAQRPDTLAIADRVAARMRAKGDHGPRKRAPEPPPAPSPKPRHLPPELLAPHRNRLAAKRQ